MCIRDRYKGLSCEECAADSERTEDGQCQPPGAQETTTEPHNNRVIPMGYPQQYADPYYPPTSRQDPYSNRNRQEQVFIIICQKSE